MKNDLFVTALKNGEYISIDHFKPQVGEGCDCICPECGQPVRSNITSKSPEQLKINYTNHFSHIDKDSTCYGGYKETELHLFAKKIIEEANKIVVPGTKFHYPDSINYNKVVLEPAFPINEYKQYRPDIIITSNGNERIAIEIFVTNDLNTQKINLYNIHQFKCFKIDLSPYYKKDFIKIKLFLKEAILDSHESKKWIYPSIEYQDEVLINNNQSTLNKENSTNTSPAGCIITLFYFSTIISILIIVAFLYF